MFHSVEHKKGKQGLQFIKNNFEQCKQTMKRSDRVYIDYYVQVFQLLITKR